MSFSDREKAILLGNDHVVKSVLFQKIEDDKPSYYLVEEFERYFDLHYVPTMLFESDSFLQFVQKNRPILLSKTVLGAEHRKMGACYRKAIFSGPNPALSIQFIDDEMGYGLFAEADFEEGAFIGVYAGLVKKIARFKPSINAFCMHYPTRFFSYHYLVIDAENYCNEMRFLNHSDTPNLRPFSLIDRGLLHTGFFTIKPIKKGSELTFSYGKDYWKYRTKNSLG